MADQFRRSFDDMARQAELEELRDEVNKLKNTPMTDLDYESFGITGLPDKPIDLSGHIEDVGAAPPKLDEPQAVPAPETPASSPVTQEEARKLESPSTGTAG
jgi:sec-independent protein translocase protein TatB